MKLPNFYISVELNSLRASMGIAAKTFGEIRTVVDPARLSVVELERITSIDGLDIDIEDLRVLPDQTLAYKDSRVLLYIRDVTVYGSRDIEPKFHLSNCDVLQSMRKKNRFNRYVVSVRVDGRFNLNLIDGARRRTELRDLKVCQVCLNNLHYDGFRMEMPRQKRYAHVRDFLIADFFKKYSKSLHASLPMHNSDNAPLNDYGPGFSETSMDVRAAALWRCQRPGCGVDLSRSDLRKYLHTHHLNGLKSDNSRENLVAFCLACHAEQPSHGHMKNLPEYAVFIRLRARLLG